MTNEQVLQEFVRRFEKRCIDTDVYPAIVQRQLELTLDEMYALIKEQDDD